MISAGRWEDAFDDATGLETMNQISVSDGLLRLSDNIHQVWEISSQVSFQAGNLNQVDAQAQPGALQLALQDLDFSPNQLVSVTPDNSFGFLPYFTPPALVNDGGQTLHLAWADGLQYDIHYRCSLDAGENWEVLDPLTGDGATTVQDSPAMVVGATGGVYVVWYDEQVDSDGDIYLAYRHGNFKLYLEAGSLAVNQGPFLIASPWGLPGPLPPGLEIAGEVYEVTAAANMTALQKPALLRFHYDPLAGEPLQNPAIYRWHTPSASWQAMGGQIDLEKREVTTTTTELGIYTLLGTPSTKSAYVKQDNPCLSVPQETVYLPLLVK
jgi:hypothetical protein